MASFLQAAKDAAKKAVIEKLPGLIEENEEMITTNLRGALLKMQPPEAAVFLQHWQKLDQVVQDTLRPNPVDVGGKKRTKTFKKGIRHKKK
jgi:hypothetical protein